MGETPAVRPTVFTRETVETINRAYAVACDIIAAEHGQEHLRPVLAEHMMELARSGERDADRLCSLSVLAVLGRRSAGPLRSR